MVTKRIRQRRLNAAIALLFVLLILVLASIGAYNFNKYFGYGIMGICLLPLWGFPWHKFK